MPRSGGRGKPRILVIAQGVKPTGFARVAESIMLRLHRDFDFYHFAMNWTGRPPRRPWTILPNTILGDPYGETQIPALLGRVRPDVVLTIHDYWLYSVHQENLKHHKTIVYCPVDGPLSRPGALDSLRAADRVVAYSGFGKVQLLRTLGAAGTSPDIPVIGHIIETAAFRTLLPQAGSADRGTCDNLHQPGCRHNREAARSRLFPEDRELADCFIVLNANRNNIRKRLDITLEAFSLFASGKPANVRLYLHAGIKPRSLPNYATYRKLRESGRILHTDATKAEFPDVSDRHLNLIYNACDVGLNTASAEAWGLVTFEHAATGAAQVLPGHPTCRESWHRAGAFVCPGAPQELPGDYITHCPVRPEDVASALEVLYRDPALRACQARLDYGHAVQSRYSGNHVSAQWRSLFHEVIGTGR
jgi:D-inositol-3-phosphate glycosyltransferase